MAVDHGGAALPTAEPGLDLAHGAAGAAVRRTGLWKDAVHRFTRNRAAVAA